MADQRVAPGAYRDAQVQARLLNGRLTREAAQRVAAALERYAARIEALVASLQGVSPEARLAALTRSQHLFLGAAAQLRAELDSTIASTRQLAFSQTLAIQHAATVAAAEAHGVPHALLGAVRAPAVTLLGAFEALGSAASLWQTLVRGYIADAVSETEAIVRQALLAGSSADELARALRPYVAGSEEFHQAFGALAAKGIDLRVLRPTSPALRNAAKELRYNAARIAYSELHNARAEAEVQAFAVDPLVTAVGWRLSPFRGTQDGPDVCDVLARANLYGLGAGVYPVTRVPVPPHPWDRCERVPVVDVRRALAKGAVAPKPNPPVQTSVAGATVAVLAGHDLSDAETASVHTQVGRVLSLTASSGATQLTQRLVDQVHAIRAAEADILSAAP